MLKIAIATQCYKRPERVKEFLESVEKNGVAIHSAHVFMQPETVKAIEAKTTFPVEYIYGAAKGPALARKVSTAAALKSGADIIWLTDDDITCLNETDFVEAIRLAESPYTGMVCFTRLMTDKQIGRKEVIPGAFQYIGNGILINRNVLSRVTFTNDAADEIEFSLQLYLMGYNSYRSQALLIKHDQGGAGNGGLYRLLKDHKNGEEVPLLDSTKYETENKYIMCSLMDVKYRGIKANFKCVKDFTVTEEAKKIRRENREALLKGVQNEA